ncbi:mechanosensitive ion channel family protein [Ornithinimicrobium cryptoxanthini]|uniref:Mechanosensitive ion channel family protein n=1 Tax=Ornithinimicrobium cryptoxanthini TaxID=2934161 RepID=A0ABY4YFA5_9MICO|nr:mechanosensitive ion channel family protein [Ornithinimicrobium cryptoxanthini]USQ75460.1 mechanosensitive ion channel family protein [Ornithinimicrobium cryptoxanthini]
MPFSTWSEFGAWLLGAPVLVLVTIVMAVIARWLAHRAIKGVVDNAVERAEQNRTSSAERLLGVDAERRRQRALTMGSLLRSVATFVIATIAILTVMSLIGLPLGPLLASAGVGGVALGFGAQSLVKDFLSGIFMIVEDQYGVGDRIDTGEAVGTVEEVTLRVTRLRDASGVVWFVRNGEIVRIGNQSQGWAMATIDLQVAATEDPARVIPVVERVVAEVYADPAWAPKFVEEPSVAGIESVASGAMTIRVFAKCLPGEQWGVPRRIRERAKAAFDAEKIRMPPVPYTATEH